MATKPRTRARHASQRKRERLAGEIVDAALALAADSGWDNIRLGAVAQRLGTPLAEILDHYRDLDGVADAWFRQGCAAMLAPPPRRFAAMPAEQRLFAVIMRWFDALESHRRVTGEMLRAKLYPTHPHYWMPMIFNLSRTIHWVRDAALLDAGGRRRQAEEIGLTLLFLATLAAWLRDDSEDQEQTRAFLRRRLAEADRLMVRLWGRTEPPDA